MAREKGTIEEFMKHLGLPQGSICLGPCVHHPDRDEFLAYYNDNKMGTLKKWTPFPDFAKTFGSQLEAEKVAKDIGDGSICVFLFDVGKQIIAATP